MEAHDHDGQFNLGLQEDMKAIVGRRRALKMMAAGAGGLLVLAACGKDSAQPASPDESAGTASTGSTGSANYTAIPEETAGPFPGDGSNGVNALTQSGICAA